MVMFPQQAVTATHVRENLLRMKAPDRTDEMDALWEASKDLSGIDLAEETSTANPTSDTLCRLVQLFDNIDSPTPP